MSQSGGVFALNPGAQVRVESVTDDCPVLIVDNFYADPYAVRALALHGNFDSTLAYYPGVHNRIDRLLLQPLFAQIALLLQHTSGLHCAPSDLISDFSLVTTPASEMLATQKHPHVDNLPLAGVIYLSPDLSIGTSFFRHIPLNLSMLRSPDEVNRFGAWLQTEGERSQPSTYAVEDGTCWQRLHTVSGEFNRLVMYPGNAFHSIAMEDVSPTITLETARLTQRLFVRSLGDKTSASS